VGQGKDREITCQLSSQVNQTLFGKEQYHLLLTKNRVGWWETKTKIKTLFPLPILFLPHSVSFPHSELLYLLPSHPTPQVMQGGRRTVVAVRRVCLCFSLLFMLFPCSSMGFLPWESVLHELLQQTSFPWAAVLQQLLSMGPNQKV